MEMRGALSGEPDFNHPTKFVCVKGTLCSGG
jgi:hypothetical protein